MFHSEAKDEYQHLLLHAADSRPAYAREPKASEIAQKVRE